MVRKCKERRWARVATAVALCLPCSSFAVTAGAQSSGADELALLLAETSQSNSRSTEGTVKSGDSGAALLDALTSQPQQRAVNSRPTTSGVVAGSISSPSSSISNNRNDNNSRPISSENRSVQVSASTPGSSGSFSSSGSIAGSSSVSAQSAPVAGEFKTLEPRTLEPRALEPKEEGRAIVTTTAPATAPAARATNLNNVSKGNERQTVATTPQNASSANINYGFTPVGTGAAAPRPSTPPLSEQKVATNGATSQTPAVSNNSGQRTMAQNENYARITPQNASSANINDGFTPVGTGATAPRPSTQPLSEQKVATNGATPQAPVASNNSGQRTMAQDGDYARITAPDNSLSVTPAPTSTNLDGNALKQQNAAPASDLSKPQETTENKAVLKENYDFFPPITKDYKPDPAYAKVRWQGREDGESSQRSVSNGMSQQAFNSTSDSPSRVFLRNMVTKALSYSPELRAASAEVLSAEYNVNQAKGQRWPQVRLGISSPLTTVGGDSRLSTNNSSIGDTSGSVSVSTPILDWGKISNQVDNAEETVKATRYSKDYSREQLAYSTISELMNLSRYQHSQVVAKAYVDRMKELVDMLSQITQADPGRTSELVQAQAKLMSAQASLDNITHQLSVSRIKLVRLLGAEPELPQDISWRDTVIPTSVALSSLDKNPMMLNLQAKVKAAEYEAESIKSSSLPQINWVVSKSTAKNMNGDESGWYTGLNMEWDAFSGGSQRAAQMSARARANAAQQQYDVSYRDLEYQINNQVQIRDSSFLRADDYDRLSSETDRVRQMFYDQWYHLGKRTLLDVLTAENDHFNNQLSAINNRYDGYISNINVISSAAMLLTWVGITPEVTQER